MSEKLTKPSAENEALLPTKERPEVMLPTAEKAEPLRPGEADPAKALKEARATVDETNRSEAQPNPLEALQASEKASQAMEPRRINRELKQITLRRELQQIQRKLPLPQRALSKVIHQPVVRAASAVAGQTISRPSGLLGGGLVAFLGTSGYLYLARHIGFTYNYLVFLLLLAGGFLLGLVLELLVYLALGSRRRAD
jgi:hypothetical protein